MTSGAKRADGRGRGGLLAATGSKRTIPRLVIGVLLILEPVPHGVDVKPDFIRAEEPEGLAAIGQDHKFGCSARCTQGSCDTRETRKAYCQTPHFVVREVTLM